MESEEEDEFSEEENEEEVQEGCYNKDVEEMEKEREWGTEVNDGGSCLDEYKMQVMLYLAFRCVITNYKYYSR